MVLPEYPTSAITAKAKLSSTPSPLVGTPNTPALIPTQPQEEEEDDDWEHITEFQERKGAADVDEDDDGDMIVLGEIEMDEVVEEPKCKSKSKSNGVNDDMREKTYAAVVGTA